MKRLLLSVCIPALTFFGFSLKAHAAETHSAPAFMNAEGEGIFPKGKTNDAYAQYFNGTSYLQALSTEGVAIANVTFEPGCRNFWHIHHKGGQILLVTGGRGWYQQWEKPALALKPGDVFRRKGLPTNGWNKYLTKNTSNSSKGAHHVTLGI